MNTFVSRAGEKLSHALSEFQINVTDRICADFGSSTGGFVDCLLQNGAAKVYAVDTAYGELAWKLRNDPKVVVMERSNAMHVTLPEKMDFISIDTGWTKLQFVLPNVVKNLKDTGIIVALIKPHYEAPKQYLEKGRLRDEKIPEVLESVQNEIRNHDLTIHGIVESPIVGDKGKNREFLAYLSKNS